MDTSTATDWGPTAPNYAVALGGVSFHQPGPLGDYSVTTDGSTGWLETTKSYDNPETFTILAWFKTATANEGMLGFSQTANPNLGPNSWDRDLWLNSSGDLVWGVYSGANDELTSTSAVDTGSWTFAAATLGAAGMSLYVNGTSVASATSPTSAQNYWGYWTIGEAWLSQWPNAPSTYYFNGSLAQVAIIPSQLTSAQVSGLYADTTLSSYTAGVNALSPANYWPLDDTGSAAYTGTLATRTIADTSGNANIGASEGIVSLGTPGPSALGANALTLDGQSGWVQTTKSYLNPENFSLVIWFETAAGESTGGPLFSFMNVQNVEQPTSQDRMFWMDSSGELIWGVYNSTQDELYSGSTNTYDDGAWHMGVVEVSSSGGMEMWVDGTEIATMSTVTTAQDVSGYWHIANMALWGGWSNLPTSPFWPGSISEAAIVPSALSSTQISALYSAGSTAAYASDMASYAPTSYWPMQDPANVCGVVETTVGQTVGGVSSCLYPSGAGTCPSPSTSYLATGLSSVSPTAPTSTGPVTVTVTSELTGATGIATSGLHLLLPTAFEVERSGWSAQVSYSSNSLSL